MSNAIEFPSRHLAISEDLGVAPPLPQAPAGVRTASVPRRRWRIIRGIASMVDWLFGFATIVVGLAVLSVIPVLNFLSLGYLLEVSGRVASTGRFRDGFIGVRKASVLGSLAAGTWLMMWPARLLSGLWRDAELIAPGSAAAAGWRLGLIAVTALTFLHIGWAAIRGGRLHHFLWPAPFRFLSWLRSPHKIARLRSAVVGYAISLHIPHYFSLGLRGFVGAVAWLIIPVGILLAASKLPPTVAFFVSLPGGFLMLVAVLYLPFLQANFARTGRFGAMFEVREVRALFRRAPLAFWMALVVTLLFAVPLYLLKIELTPRELAWLPSLFFVAFIYPARVLTGWAMGRGLRREKPRLGLFRWLSRLTLAPLVAAYVLFVYLTQYFSWNGAWSLLEQHAFLVPAPLMFL